MGWNDERIELLKKLWADGLSASQIAGQLGGVTRNAVIGKVHRLGLSGRAKTPSSVVPRVSKPRKEKVVRMRRTTRGFANAAVAEAFDDPAAMVVPLGPRISILELTDATCRWPIGEPGKEGFGYCGVHHKGELPYCPYHARAAYESVADRRQQKLRNDMATAIANVARVLPSPSLAAAH
jgi:GcrA cell cycle regulator